MADQTLLLPIDENLKRLITLALTKYQKEIDAKISTQKSQLMVALYEEESSLIRKSLKKINPVKKDFLPTLTVGEQKKLKELER